MFSEEIKRRMQDGVDGNTPLAGRIDMERLRAALEKPLNMNRFIIVNTDKFAAHLPQESFNACGTIGCIAGNAVMNEVGYDKASLQVIAEVLGDAYDSSIQLAAAAILQLTYEESEDLFYVEFPEGCPVGSKQYNSEVKLSVNGWLKRHGVADTIEI